MILSCEIFEMCVLSGQMTSTVNIKTVLSQSLLYEKNICILFQQVVMDILTR